MKNKLPVNSYADKLEIQSAKYSRILHFLGNQYEVFSTIEIIAQLLELSRSSTSRTLKQMVRDGLLIEDNNHWIHGHKVSLYAINQAGLLAIDAPLDAPSYDDRATSNYINHKIQNQRIAIIIQKQLEAEYKCERELRIFHKGLKKIPDGLCEAFWLDGKIQGNRIMTEVELEPKTLRRLKWTLIFRQ
jgi:hypothetical protein